MFQNLAKRVLSAAALAALGSGLGYALVAWSAPESVSAMTVAWIVGGIVGIAWLMPEQLQSGITVTLSRRNNGGLLRSDHDKYGLTDTADLMRHMREEDHFYRQLNGDD